IRAPQAEIQPSGTGERVEQVTGLTPGPPADAILTSLTSRIMDPNDQKDRAEFPTSPPTAEPMHAPRPRGMPVEVDLAALSHPGRVRPNNEDHYLVLRGGRYLRTCMTNLPEGRVPYEFEETLYLMAVADGIGGRAAGEVASQLALTLFVNHVLDTP